MGNLVTLAAPTSMVARSRRAQRPFVETVPYALAGCRAPFYFVDEAFDNGENADQVLGVVAGFPLPFNRVGIGLAAVDVSGAEVGVMVHALGWRYDLSWCRLRKGYSFHNSLSSLRP